MLKVHTQPDQRRHPSYPPTDLHSTSTPLSTQHYIDSLSSSSPSDTDKLLRSYYLTAANLDTFNNLNQSTLDNNSVANNALMTSAYDFSGPAIRIQQSTPIPQLPQGYTQSPMLATGNQTWDVYGAGALGANSSSLFNKQHSNNQMHQRALSASSNPSQYQSHTTTAAPFTYSGIPDHSPPASSVNKVDSAYSADQASGPFTNHLPTPSQTPTSDSFLSPAFQTFAQHGAGYDNANAMAAHMAMKQAMMDPEDDVPGVTHSSRHSVSSYGNNSPATPRTVVGDDFDDKYKSNDYATDMKIEGSTPDSFQYTFNQSTVPRLPTQVGTQPTKGSLLTPTYRRSLMADRLQAANVARSQSPTSSRGVSPFKSGSPLAPVSNSFGSPRQRFGGAQVRDQTTDAAVKAFALKNHSTQNQGPEPKTISPKDALLEYNDNEDESQMPLFPPEDSAKFAPQFSAAAYENLSQTFDNSSEHSFGSMATSRPETWNEPFGSTYATATPPQSNFNFAPPSIAGSLPVSNGITFGSSQYRPATMQMRQDATPDFPAHLTSMESSASDSGAFDGSIPSSSAEMTKPGPSAANSGTYSCTYHGCPMRFETPQKLQKHKREGHRQAPTNITSGIGSGMSADELLARNSQAGPHKCERINPTTGKPCDTVFSRPYDLTRHEDTIHNARKQKVRCALCVEEKTFSRNDALTRHMRVVHPEVDFPGKHRRRGHGHE